MLSPKKLQIKLEIYNFYYPGNIYASVMI